MNTLIVYHRCGGKTLGYPPNTTLTGVWAMAHGARAIEYDVAIAKDGDEFRVFVIEPKLLKDAGLDINNLSWDDVKRINAGNEKFGLQPVSLLEEMITAVDSEEVSRQIQIKGTHPASVREVLAKAKEAKNYIITAFDIGVIKKIKEVDSGVRVGWLVKPQQEEGGEAGVDLTAKLVADAGSLQGYSDDEIAGVIKTARENNVDVVLLCGPRITEQKIVDDIRSAGFEVGAWGVATNLGLAKKLIGFELDRFTLDNPEELQSV